MKKIRIMLVGMLLCSQFLFPIGSLAETLEMEDEKVEVPAGTTEAEQQLVVDTESEIPEVTIESEPAEVIAEPVAEDEIENKTEKIMPEDSLKQQSEEKNEIADTTKPATKLLPKAEIQPKNALAAETEDSHTSEEPQEPDDLEMLTYTLMVGEEVYGVLEVEKGEVALFPDAPPLKENQTTFKGWYSDPNGGTQYDISQPAEQDQTLYARFGQTYTLQFKDGFGKVYYTQILDESSYMNEPGTRPSLPDRTYVKYWYEEGDETETQVVPTTGAIKPTRNMSLVPKLEKQWAVNFITLGAISNVVPIGATIAVNNGELATEPTDIPEKEGYNFVYWSLEQDGEAFDFDTPITEDTRLYAVFEPVKEREIQVVYYREKLGVVGDPGNDVSNYEYAWGTTTIAPVGEEFTLDHAAADQLVDDKGWEALKYSEYSFATTEMVEQEGAVFLYVYYKLINYELTFTFSPQHSSAGNYYEIDGKQYVDGTPETDRYTLTAKYGENIEGRWPTSGEPYTSFLGWMIPAMATGLSGANLVQGRQYEMGVPLLPYNWRVKEYQAVAQYGKGFLTKVHHMFPVEQGEEGSVEYQGKYYKEDLNYYDEFYQYDNIRPFYPPLVPGYSTEEVTAVKNNEMEEGQTFTFYYPKRKYTIVFDAAGGSYLAGDRMREYSSFELGKRLFGGTPIRDGYNFVGWYWPGLTTPATEEDFKTGPEKKVFYAKWEMNNEIKVTYRYEDFGWTPEPPVYEQTYKNGDLITYPGDEVIGETVVDGYGIFNGWYYPGHISLLHDPAVPVTKSFYLLAHWLPRSMNVLYDVGIGTGEAPIDSNDYLIDNGFLSSGANAYVRDGDHLVGPEGKIFSGWKSNYDQLIYYPGDYAPIGTENLILTAVYANKEDLVQVRYHSEDKEIYSQNVRKNSTFKTQGAIVERTGKRLVGWQSKDGSLTYELNSEIDVAEEDIDLYAIWEDEQLTIQFAASTGGTVELPEEEYQLAYGQKWRERDFEVPVPRPDVGYRFDGWTPALPQDDETITENLLFTAQFVKEDPGIVTVRYVNEVGEKIQEDRVLEGELDTNFNLSEEYIPEKIGDYLLDQEQLPKDLEGVFQRENQLFVITYYKESLPENGVVIIRFVNEDGELIRSSVRQTDRIGLPFNLTDTAQEIAGYTFLRTLGSLTGNYSSEPQTITHIYRKDSAEETVQQNDKEQKEAVPTTQSQNTPPKASHNVQKDKQKKQVLPAMGESIEVYTGLGFFILLVGFVILLYKREKKQSKK